MKKVINGHLFDTKTATCIMTAGGSSIYSTRAGMFFRCDGVSITQMSRKEVEAEMERNHITKSLEKHDEAIALRLPAELLAAIDNKRGTASRSRFIRSVLERELL